MEKKIEDYLYLYLGCECVNEFFSKDHEQYMKGWKLTAVDQSSPNPYQIETCNELTWTKEVKPILRPLSSITHDEAEHFAWMCMDSRHHLDEESRINKNNIDIELAVNDGGNLLDADIEVYIGVTCRCFEGAVIIRKDGSMCVEDEDGLTREPIDDISEKVLYLLKQGFDLFGLIPAGLAIDSATLN